MNAEFDFKNYGQAMAQSLFADRVLMALAKHESQMRVTEQDLEFLKRSKQFLSDAVEMVTVVQPDFLSERSITLAEMFEQVAGAMPVSLHSKADFTGYAERLQNTIESILNGPGPETADFEAVCTFFSNYGARQFKRSQEIIGTSHGF